MEKGEGILIKLNEVRRRSRESGGDSFGLILDEIRHRSHEEPFWVGPIDSRFGLAFSVRINGQPRGKGSVRVIEYKDKAGQRRRRRVQAPKSRTYENLIALLAKHQCPRSGFLLPLDGPLIIRVLTVQQRPKQIPKKLRLPVDSSDPLGRMYAPVKPDWDNLAKSVGDGLKKGNVLADDSRIVDGRVVTMYGCPGEDPFLEAYVWALQ